MDEATVLSRMKAHFEHNCPPEVLERFAATPVTELLTESIDVIEFIVYLEDELGSRIDANQVGPALANMTFGELAAELCRRLNDEQQAKP
jgi:acyl carrier protein